MTTHKEVLELALEMVQNKMYAHAEMYLKEALAQEQEPVAHTAVFHCPNCEYPHRQVTHITGVAQPPWSPQRKEQEPMAWMCHPFGDDECEFSDHQECENCIPLYTTPPQPEQEPVAWMNAKRDMTYTHGPYNKNDIPLYTTPPQRTWVGLTDEERRACMQSPFTTENYRAIEAKLKEKNT